MRKKKISKTIFLTLFIWCWCFDYHFYLIINLSFNCDFVKKNVQNVLSYVLSTNRRSCIHLNLGYYSLMLSPLPLPLRKNLPPSPSPKMINQGILSSSSKEKPLEIPYQNLLCLQRICLFVYICSVTYLNFIPRSLMGS